MAPPTLPSVKMVDASAKYISNYKFQYKFRLKNENGKFQSKLINVFLVIYIYTAVYIICFSMWNLH